MAMHLDMNPVDATSMGIQDGETVQVSSARGTVKMAVRYQADIPEGLTFTTFHFPELVDVNVMTQRCLGQTLWHRRVQSRLDPRRQTGNGLGMNFHLKELSSDNLSWSDGRAGGERETSRCELISSAACQRLGRSLRSPEMSPSRCELISSAACQRLGRSLRSPEMSPSRCELISSAACQRLGRSLRSPENRHG